MFRPKLIGKIAMFGENLPITSRPVKPGTSELQSLDERISLLQAQKSTLQRELEKVDDELTELLILKADCHNRTAPIWKLPIEVLSHIFEIGASAHGAKDTALTDESDPNILDQPDFQILVSHVSHHFRQVAIKTPALWSNIHVLDLAEPRLDYIETCLRRSGSVPYSICLDCQDEDHYDLLEQNVAIDHVMTLVKASMYRLERLMARFRFFSLLYHVIKHLDEPAPLLTTLELLEVDYEQDFDEDTPFSPMNLQPPLVLFDGQVPKLDKLILDGVHVAWSRCNFKNLTVLDLGYHTTDVRPTYQEFQAIMQDSPSLRELSLQGSAPLLSQDATQLNRYRPFILDSLEKFRLSDISSDYATTLISLFHAPNLKTLILAELTTDGFSSMLERIAGPPALFPNLTTLKLIAIEADDDSAAKLLRAYPRLEWLGLYALHGLRQWVSLLESSAGPDPSIEPAEHLCPALKTLRCIDTDLNDIRDMISKRIEAGLPLPTLELHKDEETTASSLSLYTPPIQWLKERMDVKFVDPSDYDSEGSEDDSDWVSEDSNRPTYELDSDYGFDYEGGTDEDDDDDYEDEYEI